MACAGLRGGEVMREGFKSSAMRRSCWGGSQAKPWAFVARGGDVTVGCSRKHAVKVLI